ncbi:MAG: hypothetical protein LBU60_03330 [Clostridiales bacterium]|jgi:hypothetical protein|nr:hypothetical protein [Clostridiales bacterium]
MKKTENKNTANSIVKKIEQMQNRIVDASNIKLHGSKFVKNQSDKDFEEVKSSKFNDGCTADWEENIIKDVQEDFETRRSQRRAFEAKWQINANFALGNQYCYVNLRGDLEDLERDYFWQEREVYNHIAPILETRLAKLGRVRPKMSVRPASGDEGDLRAAKVSGKILSSACERLELDEIITKATMWSELCGTVFYKISWDKNCGKRVSVQKDKAMYEGDIRIDVCSPYEIYPNNFTAESMSEINSIIHAKALHIDDIEMIWGVRPKGDSLDVLNTDINSGVFTGSSIVQTLSYTQKKNHCIVIEKYTRPSAKKPNGEHIIIAGDKLLHYGELPYFIGKYGELDLPFVKQDSLRVPGSFYGSSIIDRAIPIQRAYNAVKNRKHEFLNRIAVGVLAVEDGSVDTQNLEDEGLAPGKILQYRQGSAIPRMLDSGRVPPEFNNEEDRLKNEFINISGVSEIIRNSNIPGQVSSGVAIQLLLEQDDTRLSLTAQSIRVAIRQISQYVIRMYRQFAKAIRLDRIVGDDGDVELMSWKSSDLTCDDVIFDTVNELSNTPAAKQNMLFELLKNGLLHDEKGRLTDVMRNRLLNALGYGGWENSQTLDSLHIKRAEKENLNIATQNPQPEDIDKHDLHIEIHTAYLLNGSVQKSKDYNVKKERLLAHIRKHKLFIQLEGQVESKLSSEQNNAKQQQ